MSIELIEKALPLLDEKYAIESRTSMLETSGTLVQETANAKTVLIAKLALQGLGDYNRSTGFVDGAIDLEWESHEFRYDRGRSFSIDTMDNEETLGVLFAYSAGEFFRLQVAPEVDAIRFAEYAQNAGTSVDYAETAETIVSHIDAAFIAMEEDEVNIDNTILFISPTNYGLIKDSEKFDRPLAPSENPNRNFGSFDGHPLVKVPKTRFYSKIDLLDGTTNGQEDGGYAQADDGVQINWMIIDPSAVIQITKHAVLRVFAPGVNQKADAYKIDYRVYHDAWVLENREKGIYVCLEAEAEGETTEAEGETTEAEGDTN